MASSPGQLRGQPRTTGTATTTEVAINAIPAMALKTEARPAGWVCRFLGMRQVIRLPPGACCQPRHSRDVINNTLYSAPFRPAPTTNQPFDAWTMKMPTT